MGARLFVFMIFLSTIAAEYLPAYKYGDTIHDHSKDEIENTYLDKTDDTEESGSEERRNLRKMLLLTPSLEKELDEDSSDDRLNPENEKSDIPYYFERTSRELHETETQSNKTLDENDEKSSESNQNKVFIKIEKSTTFDATETTDDNYVIKETTRSVPSYAVHENVIDIPDDRVRPGPIVSNYGIPLPLPTIKPLANNTKTKNHRLSILHIKSESDDNSSKDRPNKNVPLPGLFQGITNYFTDIGKRFTDTFKSIFNRRDTRSVKQKRSVNNEELNSGTKNVDRTDFFVRQRHISLT